MVWRVLKMFKLICSIISAVFFIIIGSIFLSISLIISLIIEIVELITNKKEDEYDQTE